MRVAIINPNTSAAVTADMAAIAQSSARSDFEVIGVTVKYGAPLITNAAQLATAAAAVLGLADRMREFDGVIISAFGDPGRALLECRLPIPVVGIAQAGMAEASAASNGRFSVVTTTPNLVQSITEIAGTYGYAEALTSVRITAGDPAALMADPAALEAAMAAAVAATITEDGARAVLIGGGPLGGVAASLAKVFDVPVIAPIPAAVALLRERLIGIDNV